MAWPHRYPKNYDPENPGKAPDPERWMPRRDRKGAKKKGASARMTPARVQHAAPRHLAVHGEKRHQYGNVGKASWQDMRSWLTLGRSRERGFLTSLA